MKCSREVIFRKSYTTFRITSHNLDLCTNLNGFAF